jgi:hypothetical protein
MVDRVDIDIFCYMYMIWVVLFVFVDTFCYPFLDCMYELPVIIISTRYKRTFVP